MGRGTGGTPNPPVGYTDPPIPGLAAGSSNVFRGRLVIVTGPSGAIVGVFVYAAGTTPALGNAPIFWATSSAADPYGNAIPSTAGVAGTGTFQAGTTLITPQGVLTYSSIPPTLGGIVSSLGVTAQFTDSAGNIVLPGNTSYAPIGGGAAIANSEQGGVLFVFLALSGFGTAWTQIATINATSDGDVHYAATGGAHLVADTIWFALDPVTGVRGLWNDLRPLSNSFVGTITNEYPPQYRKDPDGFISVMGAVQFPGAGGPNFNSVTFANIPLGFRPSANQGFIAPIQLVTNVTPVGTPIVQVDALGNMAFHNMPTSGLLGTIARFNFRYPLGNTGTINS